jgi:hypothetical protein
MELLQVFLDAGWWICYLTDVKQVDLERNKQINGTKSFSCKCP